MITIENNTIYRDSEKIGQIVGTVAWMNSRQAGRIIGQIKQASSIDGLTFEIVDTPEEKANLQTLSALEVVDNPQALEPVTGRDDPVAGILSNEPTRENHLGDKDPVWQRWFIATYGEDAFKAKWPTRNLPD